MRAFKSRTKVLRTFLNVLLIVATLRFPMDSAGPQS